MSRFGVTTYALAYNLDVFFKDKEVRFIAGNNGIDNDKQGDNGFTPFLNSMNESMVMYMGVCVERATSDELFESPLYPYTRELLNAIPLPSLDPDKRMKDIIRGEGSSPVEPKPGCRFASRCRHAKKECAGENMALEEIAPATS